MKTTQPILSGVNRLKAPCFTRKRKSKVAWKPHRLEFKGSAVPNVDLTTHWTSVISLCSPDKLPLSTAVNGVKSAPVEVTELTLTLPRAKLLQQLSNTFCMSSSETAAVSGGNGTNGFKSQLPCTRICFACTSNAPHSVGGSRLSWPKTSAGNTLQ